MVDEHSCCEICGFRAMDKHSLGSHISQKHNSKDYYNTYIEPGIEHRCPFCSNERKFMSVTKGYRKTCGSPECVENIKSETSKSVKVIERRKQTVERKYGSGITNPSQALEVKDKKRSTFSKNHDTTSKLRVIREKTKKTLFERYGDANYNNRAKMKRTKMEHFGDANYTNREKAKNTCQKKYGVDNYTKTQEYHRNKKHKFIYDDMSFDSSDELKLYKFCAENGIPVRYQPCSFTYVDSLGKEHVYFPDFEINGQLYEVKGGHLWKDGHIWFPYRNTLNEEQLLAIDARDLAKTECMNRNGVKVILSNNLEAFIGELAKNSYK